VPPLIQLPKALDASRPYPLSRKEQGLLFPRLPAHLQAMALFKVNTGCREQEVCGLKWDWELEVPELETSVFIIPGDVVKNDHDRLVVLNRVAASVIQGQRGRHPENVFTFRKHRIARIHYTAWRQARLKAARQYVKVFGRACPEGFRNILVHDLKHTFGRRL